jgi:hypothetical protein
MYSESNDVHLWLLVKEQNLFFKLVFNQGLFSSFTMTEIAGN